MKYSAKWKKKKKKRIYMGWFDILTLGQWVREQTTLVAQAAEQLMWKDRLN